MDKPFLNQTSPDLTHKMNCGLFTNSKGEILIVHDQHIESQVQWVEYDSSERSLILVYEDGATQSLGLEIDKKTQSNLRHGTMITLAHIKDQEIQSTQETVFILRQS